MKCDLWIRGGMLVDPARDVHRAGDVFVRRQRIVAPEAAEPPEAEQVVDATGCLVLPGLIDFHAHLYAGGTEIGIEPDVSLLPQGVTTAVDAGSAGVANYAQFSTSVISRSLVRILSYLNVSPAGLVTSRYHEDVNPKHFDLETTAALFERYRGELLGLKVRQSREIVGELGLEPLRKTVRMAESLGCRIVVHTTNPPGSSTDIADLLRTGDIFCHVFHGTGNTILGSDGAVLPGIRRARERGVLFDAANGRNHFVFTVARAALQQSFLPDVISSDLTARTLYRPPVFSLPHVMSKYLNLGAPFMDVVAACTARPARILGMEGEIGTLVPGACADIAVFRQVDRFVEFVDTQGEKLAGRVLLVPQMTVRAGRVVFRQQDF
jgi:dihydroorotase